MKSISPHYYQMYIDYGLNNKEKKENNTEKDSSQKQSYPRSRTHARWPADPTCYVLPRTPERVPSEQSDHIRQSECPMYNFTIIYPKNKGIIKGLINWTYTICIDRLNIFELLIHTNYRFNTAWKIANLIIGGLLLSVHLSCL